MADKKVSQLPALTGANTASGDLLYIVDVSEPVAADQSKKITLTEFQSAPVSAGTANGVAYLNGSKVLTTGSALTFDGTGLSVGTTAHPYKFMVSDGGATGFEVGPGTTYVAGRVLLQSYNRSSSAYTAFDYSASEHKFLIGVSDAMTLTSTGLGIGTSSPRSRTDVYGTLTVGDVGAPNVA